MIRSLLIALFLIAPLATPGPARAASPNLIVTATHHGLRLTLSIPNRAYPRYALVQVHGTVKNISGRTLWLRRIWNGLPGISNPEPEVLDHTGKVVYPPAFKYGYPLPGPFPLPQPLVAGQSNDVTYLVIIRDTRIRFTVTFTATNPHNGIGRFFRTVHTGALHLTLTPAQRPQVTTDFTPGHLVATVQRPAGAQGPLQRVEYSDCPDTTDNWTVITWWPGSTTLQPDCQAPQEWHVVAGWLDYSVVRVDYSDRHIQVDRHLVSYLDPLRPAHIRLHRNDVPSILGPE